MNNVILYRPYKIQTWPYFLIIPIGALAFMAAGYCLPLSVVDGLLLTVIGIACIWLGKALYNASQKTILFEEKGLRIIGGSCFEYHYFPWDELTYAYYTKNFRGHSFLVISPGSLSSKEVRRFANRGANSSQTCIDSVVVIYIDLFQDVSQIKELINKKIAHSTGDGTMC